LMSSAATLWALAAISGVEKVLLCLMRNPSQAVGHAYCKKLTPLKYTCT